MLCQTARAGNDRLQAGSKAPKAPKSSPQVACTHVDVTFREKSRYRTGRVDGFLQHSARKSEDRRAKLRLGYSPLSIVSNCIFPGKARLLQPDIAQHDWQGMPHESQRLVLHDSPCGVGAAGHIRVLRTRRLRRQWQAVWPQRTQTAGDHLGILVPAPARVTAL